MLPDLRFIAVSVVATIAMVVLGFGVFATFRLANRMSGEISRSSEPAAPQVVAERGPAAPSPIRVPTPPAEAAPPRVDGPNGAPPAVDPPAPTVEAPRADLAPPAPEPPPAASTEGDRSDITASIKVTVPAPTTEAPTVVRAAPAPPEIARPEKTEPVEEPRKAEIAGPSEPTGSISPTTIRRDRPSSSPFATPAQAAKRTAQPVRVRKARVRRTRAAVVRRVPPVTTNVDPFTPFFQPQPQPQPPQLQAQRLKRQPLPIPPRD